LLIKNQWVSGKWIGIFIGAFIIFLFGLWDDAYKFAYSTKLAGQIMGALVLIFSGTYVELFSLNGSNWLIWLNWIITLLWVVGLVNAFNFIDSMDNIVLGLAIIFFSSLSYLAFQVNSNDLLLFNLILLGISVVLSFFNRTPAKMFLGDSGSQTIGFLTASMCILLTRERPNNYSTFAIPILLLGIPIFNISLVVISRLRRHISVYKARLDQIYHRLVTYGVDGRTAVAGIHLVSLIISLIAIYTFFLHSIQVILILIGILLIGVILLIILDNKKLWT
jgi:UDP-GlcNAc:undecaprenyl-phosphate GlcNAc-1-phosphate transferase